MQPDGRALARVYFGTVVPWCARIGTGSGAAAELMKFYWETIANCVSPDVVLASLTPVSRMAIRGPASVRIMPGVSGRALCGTPYRTVPPGLPNCG